MLQQTKEQKQELVTKVQLLDFILQGFSTIQVPKDQKKELDAIHARIIKTAKHKLKLLDELTRLAGV